MKRVIIVVLGVLGLAVAGAATVIGQSASEAPERAVYDAASAMAFLKTLNADVATAGSDHSNHETGGASNSSGSFRTKGSGSIVILTTRSGKASEMESVTVFHMDGKDLLLTHYCSQYLNAPVMKFEKTGVPGEMKFVFVGGTNFDPRVSAHMHENVFRVKNARTAEMTYTVFSNGKQSSQGKATFTAPPK
jgi:hypothetical protein